VSDSIDIKLPYGTEDVTLHLPPESAVQFLRPRTLPPIGDEEAALREVLSEPVAADALDTVVADASNVVVLVADITRGRGSRRLLPHLINYIRDAATSSVQIKVLIARGAHRAMTKQEREFFRSLSGVSVVEHNADQPDKLSALLLTTQGTPVRTNAVLKDADTIVLFAPVSYHYFAGFGGGRKLVLPGCADRAAILANHRLSLVDGKPVTLHPACRPGNIEGNPVHDDMCETLEALSGRGLFAVNFFCNAGGDYVFLNAGDPFRSHVEACHAYDAAHRCALDRPYDVMVLSAGGDPYDLNFLQAHKALRHASGAMREGGTILFFAKCEEGIGSSSLEAALRMKKSEFLKTAYKKYALNNQTAVSLHDLTEKFDVGMVSAMNVDVMLASGIKHCVNAETFLAEAMERHGTDRLVVVTHGASVLPKVREVVL
jgi:nickel-dependent lactate racemase